MVKQSNDNEASVRFLLAEHQYFRESLHQNEEVGEKRVNYFISLTTVMITAFVALMSLDNAFLTFEQLLLITVVAMLGLLVIGWLTMLRILKRNKNTDKCKERLDLVRELFRRFDTSGILEESYWPYGKAKIEKLGDRKWGSGGLREMIIAMNSIITVVIIVIVLELIRRIFYSTWIGGYIIIVLGGILASIGAWKIQKWLVKRNVNKESNSKGEPKKWEWRVFSKDLNNNPWKTLINGEKNPIEDEFTNVEFITQSDCYINLGASNAGLKIRGIESKSSKKKTIKLELKVLLDKIGEIEYWKKYILKPITNAVDDCRSISIDQILKLTKREIQNINLNKIKSQMIIDAMNNIINSPQDNITSEILIIKERRRIRALYDKVNEKWRFNKNFISNPEVIIIEQTEGTIHLKEKPDNFWTFSIESESFKSLQRFKDSFSQIKNDNLESYSYPNYIMSLLK